MIDLQSLQADRLAELEELETLSDAEMEELNRLSPPGRFKRLPNLFTIGMVDVEQAFHNLQEGPTRSRTAYEAGCYIEVISLRLQHIDFWLRFFWVARNKKGKIFSAKDKRTFGVLLSDCARLGFKPPLVERMRAFNVSRTECIHGYLLGLVRYEDLKKVCDDHQGLDGEVSTYVRAQVGVPWTV